MLLLRTLRLKMLTSHFRPIEQPQLAIPWLLPHLCKDKTNKKRLSWHLLALRSPTAKPFKRSLARPCDAMLTVSHASWSSSSQITIVVVVIVVIVAAIANAFCFSTQQKQPIVASLRHPLCSKSCLFRRVASLAEWISCRIFQIIRKFT